MALVGFVLCECGCSYYLAILCEHFKVLQCPGYIISGRKSFKWCVNVTTVVLHCPINGSMSQILLWRKCRQFRPLYR